jgi:uncharacterized protein YgbK (DUF1537 family)
VNTRAHAGPLYAWYGDDFTGSTDVLEALALYGVKAVLFTRMPDERGLRAFANCKAIGIAGESRSRTPAWMSANLPAVFTAMRSLGARVNHYKVCSTFDSSPQTGSIGRAMELGRALFHAQAVPIVVGAPHLGRAVVYGNLFADANGEMVRIDRHPAMRHHPVTPMTESDLRLHLAQQTTLRIGLVDTAAFQSGAVRARFESELEARAEAVLFDGFNESMLDETARLLWDRASAESIFAVGSSGLTHGLLRRWRELQLISEEPAIEPAPKTDRLLVLSGSCSPATAAQIRHAQQLGFAAWQLDGASPWRAQAAAARDALKRGESVVLYTALGPQPMDEAHGEDFGTALGKMLRELVLASGVRRVVIAGGDTSTHAVKQMELDALTFAAPLVSGVPLCRAHAPGSELDGLELALKGGQIGPPDFFRLARDGS